ncbi:MULTISPECIES: response regulator [Oscillospiraceae]|uniref:response regulator n=1 Tax=Oscillospiraceae TaxID=216572 RepID=UPI0009A8E0B4|nr:MULTISPECIES: response regulator [Oscillospiraceae]RGB67620.1 response regulator [Harryflintia acetispora]
METYRVLLVDDEEEIREGISRKIDWASLGFELVGEAENGAEALELCEQLRPDVVLTDIKMPFIDGLELCRRLRTQLPAARTVVFSGFDDFEYARQAISMNVSEYILKPINAPELRQVLQKLRGQLDRERAERRDMETLRRQYEESLPVLRELFFTRLLDGRVRPDQVRERADRFEIGLPEGVWAAALIQVDGAGEDDPVNRDELLLVSVRALFEEHFSLKDCTSHLILYNDTVALLTTLPRFENPYPLIAELDRVCALSRSYLDLTLTVGVGRPCFGPQQLHLSVEEARWALDYRVLAGPGRVLYIGDLEPDGSVRLSFDEADERELSAAIKLGDREQLPPLIESLIARVREAGLALPQCQIFFLELLTSLIKLARSGGVEPEEVFGEGFTGMVQLTDFRSPEELGRWCCERCLRLQELLGRRRIDSAGRTVEAAKAYIAQNFADSDLGVDALCAHLHLSPAYFSTLFKRETGMGFTAYVTDVRMEEAVRLLRESGETTYRIAERTGYQDPNYFSYVFKKHFGMSPSKFRAGLKDG